jgi:type I restriction enzyme, S subunit
MSDNNNIPKNWQITDLKSITESIQYGYTESSTKEKVGPKFLRITDIQDNKVQWDEVPYCRIDHKIKSKYLLKDGDLVFARTGATVGKSFLIKGNIPETVFASYLIRVRVNLKMNEKYLSYFFQSPNYWNQITEGQVGIGQPNVNGTKLGQLKIPIAPLETQQAIVSRIEELLSDLENGKQQLQTAQQQLKVYRQSLLKAAFEGKLTNKEVKEGELPKGWKVVKIEDIATVGTGATPLKGKSYYYEGGTIAWVTSGALNDEFVREATDYVTELALKETNISIYPKHTLLLAMYGEGKTRGKCSELLIEASTNQAIAAIHFKNHDIRIKSFLKYFLLKNYNDIRMLSSGGVQPNLNLGIVKKTLIPMPSFKEQQFIVNELESKLTVCNKIEETINQSLLQAETLRQSILKKAFEGKLVY